LSPDLDLYKGTLSKLKAVDDVKMRIESEVSEGVADVSEIAGFVAYLASDEADSSQGPASQSMGATLHY
jgi:hypothetical protein